jgi:hypothetical protein
MSWQPWLTSRLRGPLYSHTRNGIDQCQIDPAILVRGLLRLERKTPDSEENVIHKEMDYEEGSYLR